jgi:hypothetical protein
MVQVVGAGLGRTGTLSLKLALEQLLGAPCYHMMEVFGRPDDVAVWQRAVDAETIDWPAFFEGYEAVVDWPACAFWRQISDAFPDAPVLLSTRASADAWFTSANDTIFGVARAPEGDGAPLASAHRRMVLSLWATTFTSDVLDPDVAERAYESHNEAVRSTIPAERLIDWQPGDGWEPIFSRLGLPVPDAPFPHANTTEDFRARRRTGVTSPGQSPVE